MNKFILGSILAAISLMVIYGTSASNQITSWVDGEDQTSAQSDFGPSDDDSFVALSPDGTGREPNISLDDRTPLQKAGDIPKRQIGEVTSTPNFGADPPANTGDDTGGVPVTPNPPAAGAPGTTTDPQTPATTQTEEPIRALW